MAAITLVPPERIERVIVLLRGQKVILDQDLAELYGVKTGQLIRQVKRNRARFPEDFAFPLTVQEFADLKCQIGISSSWGGRRTPPWAFTEQGVAMLSGVLHSPRAIEVNVAIMRAFVRLREILTTHKELARKLDDLERKVAEHDVHFHAVFEAIRQLMTPPAAPENKRKIGFARD